MTKTFAVAIAAVLTAGSARAQSAPPEPAPAPESEPESAPASAPTTQEKASNANLQEGAAAARPWAAGVTTERQQKAMELFREGNSYHNDGLFVKAVELYQKALANWDHPAIHYNLALSLMNLDRPIEVENNLRAAIKYGPAPLAKDKYDHAREYLLLIEKQLATVDIRCAKPGAKVSVDGKEVYTVGAHGEGGTYTSRVRIGKHTFVAEKPGYNAEIEAPFIGPGETFRIDLKLYTAEELTRYHRRWDATWVPYAVIGGGVAFALAGGGLELWANKSYDDFDSAVARCTMASGSSACAATSDIKGMRDSGDTKKLLGYVAYGVGGAAVLTGAILVYLNRTTEYQITADEYRRELREKEKQHARIVPMVAPGAAGAMVSGAF